ncbi:MAG: hypothetical protein FH749_13575 [Firmicutes bacterium]|nr:hypothetical protein [Bacillota bacterium]
MVTQCIAELQPLTRNDDSEWKRALADFGYERQPVTMVYPAAGFDWRVPVALARLRQRVPNLPEPELSIYIDYSADLLDRLEHAHITGDRQFWGPGVQLVKVVKLSPPGDWVWKLRARGQHNPEGGSIVSDYWYLLQVSINRRLFPILYVPADGVAFVQHVLAPLTVRPDYLVTVTDGCRQGGGWCCLSDSNGPLFAALEATELLPHYWLTDHGDLPYKFHSLGRMNTGLYGNGQSKLLAIN